MSKLTVLNALGGMARGRSRLVAVDAKVLLFIDLLLE